MEFALPADSRLFATTTSAHYDQVILPEGLEAGTAFYARRKANREWYALMARDVAVDEIGETGYVSFEDPHQRAIVTKGHLTARHGGLDMPDEHDDVHYSLQSECPMMIDAFHLPVDERVIRFLGYTKDLTRRLVVVDSVFYPGRYTSVYTGSSFHNPGQSVELAGDAAPLVTEDSLAYKLPDGEELLIRLTGASSMYRGQEFFRVDPAAYTFREAFYGLMLERR